MFLTPYNRNTDISVNETIQTFVHQSCLIICFLCELIRKNSGWSHKFNILTPVNNKVVRTNPRKESLKCIQFNIVKSIQNEYISRAQKKIMEANAYNEKSRLAYYHWTFYFIRHYHKMFSGVWTFLRVNISYSPKLKNHRSKFFS